MGRGGKGRYILINLLRLKNNQIMSNCSMKLEERDEIAKEN